MPQLDISSYTSQIFWLVIILGVLYAVILYFVLPDLARILKFRTLNKSVHTQAGEVSMSAGTSKKMGRLIRSAIGLSEDILSRKQMLGKVKNYCDSKLFQDLDSSLVKELESIYIKSFLLDKIRKSTAKNER